MRCTITAVLAAAFVFGTTAASFAPVEAQQRPRGQKTVGVKKCPEGVHYSDYAGCVAYNIKMGWTNPTDYCTRACPGG